MKSVIDVNGRDTGTGSILERNGLKGIDILPTSLSWEILTLYSFRFIFTTESSQGPCTIRDSQSFNKKDSVLRRPHRNGV